MEFFCYADVIEILRIVKNISFYLMLNYACENYLSNVVEQIDNIIEALYNYDSKCWQQWIIVYYFALTLILFLGCLTERISFCFAIATWV